MPYIHDVEDFKRIVLPGEPHAGREGLRLDFKRDIGGKHEVKGKHNGNDKPQLSTAIDVAAFANADGGVLVFGVVEEEGQATQVLPDFKVEPTLQHVEQALTTYTYGFDETPRPQVVETESGAVVVVNVLPSPRLVMVRKDRRAIYYPIRQTYGNDYLKPEEIEARLDSRYPSRFRWRLEQFVRAGLSSWPIRLTHISRRSKGGLVQPSRFAEGRVYVERTQSYGVVLRFVNEHNMESVFEIPYEWIVSAWSSSVMNDRASYDCIEIMVAAHVQWTGPDTELLL